MKENKYMPEGYVISEEYNRIKTSSYSDLEQAQNEGMILEAMAIKCDENYCIHVDLGNIKGIIPREEVTFSTTAEDVRDIAVITRVGKAVCFKVTGFIRNDKKTTALLSRRAAQLECYNKYILSLSPGDIIDCKVTHLETFGVFCDIGCGITALMTLDCISVSRISHPRDRFKVGDRFKGIIKNIDTKSGRIFISQKELLGTWEENASLFSPGQTVVGIVRSIENYGIFVELTPNLAGLAEFRPDISVGQVIAVYIKSIIPDRMKLKLVIIDSYRGELEPAHPSFEIIGDHIDYWRYSPVTCDKVVMTDFSQTI